MLKYRQLSLTEALETTLAACLPEKVHCGCGSVVTVRPGRLTPSLSGVCTRKPINQYPVHGYLSAWSYTRATVQEKPSSKTRLGSGRILLKPIQGQVSIKCSIFQGDAQSLLLFCIGLDPLSQIITKRGCGYRNGTTISHLIYKDDIKLYAKSERGKDSLIHITRICNNDIDMSFGL